MAKKTPLLPLTLEALTPAAEAAAGKATTWTVKAQTIIDQVPALEERRIALKLPKKLCIGIEGIYLTDTPHTKAYARMSRTVNGSSVRYRYTKDGWKVVSIERVDRPAGDTSSRQLIVPEAIVPEIQKRAVEDLIIRKAA